MTRAPFGAFHASNLLTYASLLCAAGALAAAANGHKGAVALIATAVMTDTLDGRFARLFRRTPLQRECGVQLDSLSDAIAFGIVPAACTALLSGRPSGWWIGAFVYAACAITRLAHYNITHDQAEGFTGLPVPVAALICASALLFDAPPAASTSIALLTAAAMIAPIQIPRPRGLGLVAFLCWPLLLIAVHLTR